MKYLPLIILITTLVSCRLSPAKQEGKGKYFEGFVEFDLAYSGKDQKLVEKANIRSNRQMITYISKEGYEAREYFDTAGNVTIHEVYRPDKVRLYIYTSYRDTVFSVDVSKKITSEFLGLAKSSGDKILGHNVEKVKTRGLFSDDLGGKTSYIYLTYYNDINYSLCPKAYEKRFYNSVEEAFSNSPYVSVKFIVDYDGDFVITATATKVTETAIPALHFDIPKNKVIIEQ